MNRFKGITSVKCEGDCIYGNCTGEHLKLPYFGIMKATFIPPHDLIHPVLPIRSNGKLKFPLCFKCASLANDKECTCSISERLFTHTYSEMMELEFKHSDDFEQISLGTNIIIASFCTSWTRLKLWSVKNKLEEIVLYHDTDSIIFSVKDTDDYILPLGQYLGQLTKELACKEIGCNGCEPGYWIEEFVSCGPKNYTYKLNTGEISCKVRGFSLNYRNSQVINFNSMKNAL